MMMDKVVLTKEQGKAIEKYKELADGVYDFIHDLKVGYLTTYSEKEQEEMKKLMYAFVTGDYEVEPEFKVGDWVVNTSSGYIKLIESERVANFLNKEYIKYRELRHATSEEIKQEKERRWWEKHGREVKEYRKGDLFIHPHDRRVYEIIEIDKNSSWPIRFIDKFGKNDGFGYEAGLIIVCFAEQRLDKEDTQ